MTRDEGLARQDEGLARQFEQHRPRLRAVAYRMLGSLTEADDAVQEAWLRASAADSERVTNLAGWLTTIVSRVCLNQLRSRAHRREEPLEFHLPDPIVDEASGTSPESEALLSDAVGLAMFVVLDTLAPAERVAFVLHDLFAVPFDDIAPILGREPAATRQLASRARRRVAEQAPPPDPDLAAQRAVVTAFQTAARGGDLTALVALLDPDVVVRTDRGDLPSLVRRGPGEVARGAIVFSTMAGAVRPVLVNGVAGALAYTDGRPSSLAAFTVVGGRVRAMDILADPERLAALGLPGPGEN
jgi:RNA polymerase sigma-70 factor (ECF subfamily)